MDKKKEINAITEKTDTTDADDDWWAKADEIVALAHECGYHTPQTILQFCKEQSAVDGESLDAFQQFVLLGCAIKCCEKHGFQRVPMDEMHMMLMLLESENGSVQSRAELHSRMDHVADWMLETGVWKEDPRKK